MLRNSANRRVLVLARGQAMRSDRSNNDDRPSQILSFSFLMDESLTENLNPDKKNNQKSVRLESGEITFFHSQKSVWFRQLLKA